MICEKITYETKAEANKAATGLGKSLKNPFRVYNCDICNKFHLTSIKKKKLLPKSKKLKKYKEVVLDQEIKIEKKKDYFIPKKILLKDSQLIVNEQKPFTIKLGKFFDVSKIKDKIHEDENTHVSAI